MNWQIYLDTNRICYVLFSNTSVKESRCKIHITIKNTTWIFLANLTNVASFFVLSILLLFLSLPLSSIGKSKMGSLQTAHFISCCEGNSILLCASVILLWSEIHGQQIQCQCNNVYPMSFKYNKTKDISFNTLIFIHHWAWIRYYIY